MYYELATSGHPALPNVRHSECRRPSCRSGRQPPHTHEKVLSVSQSRRAKDQEYETQVTSWMICLIMLVLEEGRRCRTTVAHQEGNAL